MPNEQDVWGQDGWILAKFFLCKIVDRDGVEVRKLAKKNEANTPERAR